MAFEDLTVEQKDFIIKIIELLETGKFETELDASFQLAGWSILAIGKNGGPGIELEGYYNKTLFLSLEQSGYLLLDQRGKNSIQFTPSKKAFSEFNKMQIGEYNIPENDNHVSLEILKDIWASDQFRLFISHTSSYKVFAESLRDALSFYSISAFVAHVDIEPTKDWLEIIKIGLDSADAVIALLTDDFHGSKWTDQEAGWVLGRKKLVISINHGVTSYGFLGSEQDVISKGKSAKELANEIYLILAKNPRTKGRMSEAIDKTKPKLINPGFEDDFDGWEEHPESSSFQNESQDDTSVYHSGKHSRKLFMRQGGTKFFQSIPAKLPPGSRINLSAWVRMSSTGTQENKWFELEIIANGDTEEKNKIIQVINEEIPEWKQLSTGNITFDFPINELIVQVMTTKGDGDYSGRDRVVWVDDFELEVQ